MEPLRTYENFSQVLKEWAPVLALMLIAGALRFYELGAWPPGLYHDEAYNGLDALRVLAGDHPLYFAANHGREPFFIYLVSLSVGWLGRSVYAVRFPSAIIGTLLIPAAYFMARELFGRRVGLLTAALTTITLWPIHSSLISFRAGSLPLFIALSIGMGVHAYRSGRALHWIIAGVVLRTVILHLPRQPFHAIRFGVDAARRVDRAAQQTAVAQPGHLRGHGADRVDAVDHHGADAMGRGDGPPRRSVDLQPGDQSRRSDRHAGAQHGQCRGHVLLARRSDSAPQRALSPGLRSDPGDLLRVGLDPVDHRRAGADSAAVQAAARFSTARSRICAIRRACRRCRSCRASSC